MQQAGVNVPEALRRVNGNEALYGRVLRQFAARQANFTGDMTALLDNLDPDAALRLAHTAKGLAATLGAQTVADELATLEHALRNRLPRPEVVTLLATVGQSLAWLVQTIESAIVLEPAPAVVTPTQPAVGAPQQAALAACKAVIALLIDGDPESVRCLHQHRQALQQALGAEFNQVAVWIQSFEFDPALACLQSRLAVLAPDTVSAAE